MLLFIRVKAVRGQDDEKVNIVRVASIFFEKSVPQQFFSGTLIP